MNDWDVTECPCRSPGGMWEFDEYRETTWCDALSPSAYYCSFPQGHLGPHTACGKPTHGIEVWGDVQPVIPIEEVEEELAKLKELAR